MSFPVLLGVALGLAMDAFAVAIAASATLGRVSPRQVLRLSFHFGLFQALMPTLGWLGGSKLEHVLAPWDHWVAFGLLAVIGARAITQALCGAPEEEKPRKDPTRGITMVALSAAVSMDALAVGVSLGVLREPLLLPVVVIGLVAAGMTILGMRIGSRVGMAFGKTVEVLGGLVLIAIGCQILYAHMA